MFHIIENQGKRFIEDGYGFFKTNVMLSAFWGSYSNFIRWTSAFCFNYIARRSLAKTARVSGFLCIHLRWLDLVL
jgi:hypothetical protein